MTSVTRFAWRLLTVAAICLALALTLVTVIIPRVTQGAALSVLSGSMTPTIPVGSIVLVVPADPTTVAVGDVITYQTAPDVAEYVTHRVVGIQRDTDPMSFLTKGDANRGVDKDPVPIGAVRGKVRLHVPYVGIAADVMRSSLGAWIVMSFVAGIIVYKLIKVIRKELNTTHRPAPPDVASA